MCSYFCIVPTTTDYTCVHPDTIIHSNVSCAVLLYCTSAFTDIPNEHSNSTHTTHTPHNSHTHTHTHTTPHHCHILHTFIPTTHTVHTDLYITMHKTHTSGVRGPAENRLVEGVRFQLIEGRTRPLLSQLKTDNLSESEARLKEELVLAKVEAIKWVMCLVPTPSLWRKRVWYQLLAYALTIRQYLECADNNVNFSRPKTSQRTEVGD